MRQTRQHWHPTAYLGFTAAFAVGVAVVSSPWLALAQLAALVWLFRQSAETGRQVWVWLRWAVPMALLYTLVGTLLSHAGGTVLWRGGHIPLLGDVQLTRQGLVAGLVRALRLWGFLLLFTITGRLVGTADVVRWFGRRYGGVALTIAMVLQFIPSLLVERDRIADVVRMRGAVTRNAPHRVRLRATAMVYQALLANVLERSWRLAESMHVRGYGAGNRTRYGVRYWRRRDTTLVALSGFLVLTAGVLALARTPAGLVAGWQVPARVVESVVTLGLVWMAGWIGGFRIGTD